KVIKIGVNENILNFRVMWKRSGWLIVPVLSYFAFIILSIVSFYLFALGGEIRDTSYPPSPIRQLLTNWPSFLIGFFIATCLELFLIREYKKQAVMLYYSSIIIYIIVIFAGTYYALLLRFCSEGILF